MTPGVRIGKSPFRLEGFCAPGIKTVVASRQLSALMSLYRPSVRAARRGNRHAPTITDICIVSRVSAEAIFPGPTQCGCPLKKLLISLVPFWLVACGGDSVDSSSPESAGAGSTAGSVTMTEAVNSAGVMMMDVMADSAQQVGIDAAEPPSKGVVTTDYEDSLYGLGGDYGANPRGFLQRQMDPASEGGLLNRFNETVGEHFCLLSQLLPATDGVIDLASDGAVLVLEAGDLSGEAAGRIMQACPRLTAERLAQLSDHAPLSLHYRVQDLGERADSLYERQISIGWNQSTYSDFTYYTVDAARLKLLVVRSNPLRPGKGASYAALDSDSLTGVIRFEFHGLHLGSQADRHDVYRVYSDTTNGDSIVLARSNSDRAMPESIVAVARNIDGQLLEVSFDIDAAADIRDLAVCVDRDSLDPVLLEKALPGCDSGPVVAASGFLAQSAFTTRVKADFGSINESSTLGFGSAAQVLSGSPLR